MGNKLYNLTNPQKSILLTEEFYKGSNINNICGTAIIDDVLDFDLLKKAMHIFVRNHDSFSFKLTVDNNEIKQYVDDNADDTDIEIVDIDSKDDISKVENTMLNHVFDIYNGDLFCMKIFRLPDNTGGFIVNVHHLFGDSWSLGIVANDIVRIYSCLLNSEDVSKNDNFSYLNYINSEKEYFNSDKFKKDKDYWNSIFDTVPEQATIPSSIDTTQDEFSPRANRKSFNIDTKMMEKINAFCKSCGVSVFNFFMGVYATYISRVSGVDDFVLGTPILNRTNFNEKNTTGMFINTAPLRFLIDDTLSFKSFVSNIAKDSLGMLRHQKYYYQNILEDLRKKDSSLPNLYNILISYQVTKANTEKGLTYSTRWNFNGTSNDDLDIHLYDLNDTGSINVAYDYRVAKYSDDDIEDVHNRILHMIWQILERDDICLKDIEIVTSKEKYDILYKFNATDMEYPKDKTIVDLFEEQVEKTPDNIAVICKNEKLTYRELNEKANQLAHSLINSGVNIGDIIGIMVNRSLEMIVGLLGILKSGASYLPIDPVYPLNRIIYMLENSTAYCVLVNDNTAYLLPNNINKINIAFESKIYLSNLINNTNINFPSTNMMYLIYTSGSTGNPKGVMITHKNFHNFILGIINKINFSSSKTMVSLTTISFDIFGLEIWCSLTNGLRLIIATEEDQTNVKLFNSLCLKYNVNMIQTTPSRFLAFLEDSKYLNFLDNITDIMVGGEPLSSILLNKFHSLTKAKIYNMYGPTETTVWSTIKNLTSESTITIGTPICNTHCYVLDKNMNLLPTYVIGELYIGGDGISKGYFKRDDLTSKVFLPSNFSTDILYNTKDLAYLNKYGEFVILGRSDFQVKIRGYRVELGEIENVIAQFDGITSCAVICHSQNDKQIIYAYYTGTYKISIDNLRNHLLNKLPIYMIPSHFIQIDKMPYTPNGKIDRKGFSYNFSAEKKELILPKDEFEKQVYDIVASVSNITNFSMNDNLFNIGLDSIELIKLTIKLNSVFGISISSKELYSFNCILDLVNYLRLNKYTELPLLKKSSKRDYYPISSAQKRIYYASSLDNNSTLYNIAGGIIIDNLLDTEKLKNCFNELINRHSSLRTHFEIKDNDIVQIIDDKVPFNLELDTASTDNLNDIYSNFVKPFDLSKAPLFRAKLVKLKDNKMLFLLDMHHIISDGTSLSILLQELCDLYNGSSLSDKQIDYADFTLWEKEYFKTDEFNNEKEYWVNQFESEVPLLNMPTSYPRPSTISFKGSNYHTTLPKNVFDKVNEVAKKLNITPYMLMLSCYYILLSKYSSNDDIVVGTPIIGRNLQELNNILGMFVNTLALRNKIDSSLSFEKFSENIKENCINSFKNQNYPFDYLVKDLNIQRDSSRNPLFDVMFVYQNNGYPKINFKDTKVEYFIPDNNVSKFDLTLEIIPINNEYSLRFEYCTKLFNEDFIKRLSSHYINILNAILENTYIKIADIDMLSCEERNQILYDFNNTKMDYPRDKTIVQLFEEQVEKTPDNIAVVFADKKLTYKELNEKANALANKLCSIGIKSGDVIGVSLNRSLELLVSICAIFKLGAVYMPMYTGYPKERLIYMLKNSNAKLLITSSKNKLHNFNDIEKEIIDSIDNINYQQKTDFIKNFSYNNIAYIIYTSGSTGKPKGVQICNRNLINFVFAFNKYFNNVSTKDIFLASTNISFDVSIFELFLPILTGAKLVLYTEDIIKNISLYCNTIVNNNVTALYIPPNILNEVYELLKTKEVHITKMLVGVEAIRKSTLNKYLRIIPNLKIINGYGPTETTICCTAFDYLLDETNDSIVSIGKPLYNNQIFILSKDKTLQPIGVTGEIYVAGDGVGIGYINDDNKTSLNYVLNNLNSSSTYMYKTGDLAKWNEDGTINFIGRNDSQIKISGHRIELEEINHVINCYPKIEKSFSTTYNLGNTTKIISYFTSDKDIPIKDLTAFLQSKLADYMVPNFIMQINKFPLTPNGKIDKDKLPKNFSISTKEYVAPRNVFENSIAEIWKNLFFINKIGINDNFFDLGGDSLIAIKFQIEAMNIGLNITYADIFSYPTIKQLSEKSNNVQPYDYNTSDYDYTKINELISKNRIENISKNIITNNSNIGNILLIGSTGFLGVHLLDYYLSNQTGIVYCLIREKDSLYPEERLKKTLDFYFGNKYNDLFGKRIIVVNGDITHTKFNLNDGEYKNLSQNIDVVINSAALVKHYGNSKLFNDTNVIGTSNIINFCEIFNKKLYHISTLSVSGSGVFNEETTAITYFSERDFYIGQDLSNIYIYTKFEAEKLIFEEILSGKLDACVLRIGNIANRFSDGKFQINVSENAFISRIKSIFKLGVIQKKFLKHSLEFTPVDICSEAIIQIIKSNPDFSVFHLFNSNLLRIDILLSYLECLNKKISCVDDNDFAHTIDEFLSSDELKNDIAGIITDLDRNRLLNLIANVLPNSDFTVAYLDKLGFKWPEIDINYIKKYIDYFDSINFLD